MPLHDIICVILILSGVAFIFIASIGIIRLPDFYLRMSAITKAATLGLALILIGLAIHFDEFGITAKALIIISLVFVTSPVGAHAIARAAYKQEVPFWEGAVLDELQQLQNHKKSIEQQLHESPTNEGLLNALIDALLQLPEAQGGSLRYATDVARRLRKVNPLLGHRRLAQVFMLRERYASAEDEAQQACTQSGYVQQDVSLLVDIYLAQKKYVKASSVVEAALAIETADYALYLGAMISAKHGVSQTFGLKCAEGFYSQSDDATAKAQVAEWGQMLASRLHERFMGA